MTSFIYTRYSSFLALLNFSQIATQTSHSINTVNPFPSYQTFNTGFHTITCLHTVHSTEHNYQQVVECFVGS